MILFVMFLLKQGKDILIGQVYMDDIVFGGLSNSLVVRFGGLSNSVRSFSSI
jgi:hypothetical protein